MKPIKNENTNDVLLPPEGSEDIIPLPIARIVFSDGTQAVESCWELTEDEIQEIIKTKRIYFLSISRTHPPIWIGTKSHIVRNN